MSAVNVEQPSFLAMPPVVEIDSGLFECLDVNSIGDFNHASLGIPGFADNFQMAWSAQPVHLGIPVGWQQNLGIPAPAPITYCAPAAALRPTSALFPGDTAPLPSLGPAFHQFMCPSGPPAAPVDPRMRLSAGSVSPASTALEGSMVADCSGYGALAAFVDELGSEDEFGGGSGVRHDKGDFAGGAALSAEFLEAAGYFDMPIKQAAEQLHTGVTTLKKACRAAGIQRWPFRHRHSMKKTLQKAEVLLQHVGEAERAKTLQVLAKGSKGQEADGTVKRIRQTIFKMEFKQRHRRDGARPDM